MDVLEIANAHLGRAAYYTSDNPYLRGLMSESLSPKAKEALTAAVEGALDSEKWLDTSHANQLVDQITVGTVPRDLQLVLRDGEERVGVESVHAFVRAPLFWWLISHLWCLEVGRLLDPMLSDSVMGYRLSPSFVDKPDESPQMFGSAKDAYRDWRESATEISKTHPNEVLATSTIDLQDFYYSVTAEPSAIVESFVGGLSQQIALTAEGVQLGRLLDALHTRYAREIGRITPRPETSGPGTLPLPVGLPSSQILANLVIAVALRDIDALEHVVGASAYTDDLLIVSSTLPDVHQDALRYFISLGVVEEGDGAPRLASPVGQHLAGLGVSVAKTEMSYSRVGASEASGSTKPEDELLQFDDIDPYVIGRQSPDWGGRLRTVLRSPFKRDRVPLEFAREIQRITADIRVGVEPRDALTDLDTVIPTLNRGDFLALRPLWPDIIACSWHAGGGEAIDGLNNTVDVIVSTLEAPPNAEQALDAAIRVGLRDAWGQALAEVLAVRGSRRTLRAQPREDLLLKASGAGSRELMKRAKRLRQQRFINARFVTAPLAEFTEWKGSLFGPGAFRAFVRWTGAAQENRTIDLSTCKRFVPLHEVCMANHLWLGPGAKKWRRRVFRHLGQQALIDQAMVRDLRRRAAAMVSTGKNRVERAEGVEDYTIRIALPSIEVVGQRQMTAVLDKNRQALSVIARDARDRVNRAVNSASRRDADMIVLPEWSVIRTQLLWLFARSAQHQMLVVAGEAPSVDGGTYTNRVWTGLPLVDAVGHRACLVPPPRNKQYLSPEEQSAISGRARHRAGGQIPIYAWRGITVASLICFEFADVHARERLRSRADLMTVSSFNADWRYFTSAQEATTRDNYCLSLCVNTSQFPGTALMRPTHSAMAIAATVHGSSDPAVVTRDVDMLPVVASRACGLRPSKIEGLPPPTDGLKLKDYAAVPPTFK